ncbi:hypothetical protein SLS62_004716 [Diatrype stigma]|uniref:Uncharacterized protein n=1 Tax=Diatrype stigma TaxID=117547 RepID=A0AAN9YTI8_9PEZI
MRRKAPGTWVLEHRPKGFQGAHGSRHLYNMLGGKAYEVDYLFVRAITDQNGPEQTHVLTLPSTEKNQVMRLMIPPQEEDIIKHALDCLPWNSLSWSIHRGMRDILVAYAKPVMDAHRHQLAHLLQQTVVEKAHLLHARGWDLQFVRDAMGYMAASAILAGEGNSGDSVRVVTDIVAVMVGDPNLARLDEVNFWRRSEVVFDTEAIIALTKVFVLEWSNEFDYQMYHHIPMSFRFG